MGLTRLAIHRPLTVLMGLLGLVLMGGVAYTYLKVDRLPPITIGFVSVSVGWPQASAEDVELLLIEPLENAISGMEGVQQITSTASEGQAQVSVQLVEGADPNTAVIDLERRVASLRGRFPTDAGDPVINKADPNARAILNIAFTGAPLDQLYDIASNQIQPELQSVLGVANVGISGGLQRELQVKVDYAKLAAYNLSITQVSTSLAAANVASPVGTLAQGSKEIDIRAEGRFQSPEDLANVAIAQTGAGPNGPGSPVLLRDVASVAWGYKEQFRLQRLNGQNAVGLSVTKASDANAIQVADDVRRQLDRLRPLLPAGTSVVVTNDTSVFTRAALDSIQHDVVLSVILVAAVVLLFLHEWKHTAIVLCAIPTSLISTFLGMYLFGFTLNIMSLMALALMIGILVDDSIVVLENIHRHLQMGESPWQAAINGRSEIGLAAIAITMADVVVYTPIAFMSGVVGQLFRQYGLTVVTATLLSLLVSFTLTPMLASRWVSHEPDHPGLWARFGRWWDERFARLGSLVAHTVPATIRARWLVVLVGTALVAAVGAMVPLHLLGTEYAPQEDSNNFSFDMQTPPGTSLAATDQVAREMEGRMLQIPEVQYAFTNVSIPGGGGGFFGARSGGRISIDVQLPPKSDRSRSVFDVMNQARGLARTIPGATSSASIDSPFGGGGGGGGINIQLRGPDLDTLSQLAEQIQQVTAGTPGLADLQNNSLAATPDVEIVLDHARMAQLGITAQQVSTALRTTIGGSVVSQLRPSGKEQEDITLIASDVDRANLSSLASIPVGTATGGGAGTASSSSIFAPSTAPALITVGQIATIRPSSGPVTIQRVDRNRSITLSGAANGRPLGDVAADVRRAVQTVPLPPGYSVTYGGQVQQLNTALAALGAALVLSLVLEYMLLVALYESFLFPLVRMLTVPLGLVGAFLGLYVTNNTINIFSIIGMIMAEGLVAKSGILLVDYANTLRERGMGRTEALQEAARVRLRPILMTSATMIFGMLPLALKLEPGAESRAPMAVVVIGGLLSSTLLTMVTVPALYTLFDDLQRRFSRQPAPADRLEVAVGMEAGGVRIPAHAQPAGNGATLTPAGHTARSGNGSPLGDGAEPLDSDGADAGAAARHRLH